MFSVWRALAGSRRSWPTGALAASALLLIAPEAMAQSTQGPIANAATGRSLTDAVDRNQNDLIAREVFGTAFGGGGGVAAGGFGTFSSGRLRKSEHDGLTGSRTYSFETEEASLISNAVYGVPGTVLGGQVKITGFYGQTWLSLDLKPNAVNLVPDAGSASNESYLLGGSVLWANPQGAYVLGTLVGAWGETKLTDKVDVCYDEGCKVNHYSYDTASVVASLTAGKVFPLGGKAGSGPMLDLRGSIAYTHAVGNPFLSARSDQQKYTFSTWTGSAGATLFVSQTLANNAIFRPYIQGYVRHEWGYTNEFTAIEAIQFGGTPLGTFSFDQSPFYRGVDAGFTYAFQNMVFSASLYAESSDDETTYGGRLGLGWKFEGSDLARAKAAHRGPHSWAGFYLGANAGYGWGEVETAGNTVCDVFGGHFCSLADDDPDNPPSPGTIEPGGLARAAAVGETGSGTFDAKGFTGGVQLGGNWQKGNMVVGFEIDANAFRLNGSRSATATAVTPPLADLTHTVGSSIDTNWLLTARTRFGWAFSDVLVYGTVGLALTDIKLGISYADDTGATMNARNTDVRAGYVIGGGLEWALRKDWTLKAEYLYVDFGDVNAFGVVANPDVPGVASTYEVSADLNAHIARIGVNRKF
jgi:outer membrane immunogenic protein